MISAIARAKVYLQRGTTYLNIASQAMVLRLFLVSIGITDWYRFGGLLLISSAGLILLMYLEDRAGIMQAETKFNWSRAPQLDRILKILEAKGVRG